MSRPQFDEPLAAVIGGALLLAALCIPAAHADDNWMAQDTALLVASNALLVVDLGQTLDLRHCSTCRETNAVLGAHPQQHEIYRYFAAVIAANTVLALHLPPSLRRLGLAGVIGMELGMTYHNARIGLTIGF